MTRILVVEDNDITSRAIRAILERHGYATGEAPNGKEALEILEREHYDLMITDLMLPYVNGLDLISKLKSDVSKRNLKIIVVTGVQGEPTIAEAFRLGADDYIVKPVEPIEFVNRVRKLEGLPIRKP